jgi:TatD DNase family protein
MIDSHCHLTDRRLHESLEDVIVRANAVGVHRMITIGTDLQDDRDAIKTCHGRELLRCSIGIHPNYSADARVDDVEQLRELQTDPSVIALGEMGLDYHYDRAPKAHQAEIFIAQLKLASELKRSVVIHCRQAVNDTLAIMNDFAGVPAVFHCFTGTPDEAERIVSAGYFLGFTGPVTFKKNDDLREAVRRTPLDRILVETDAPYLSPEPHRSQKTNEPALVIHIARVIAKVKAVSYEEIDRVTTENVGRLFGWNVVG